MANFHTAAKSNQIFKDAQKEALARRCFSLRGNFVTDISKYSCPTEKGPAGTQLLPLLLGRSFFPQLYKERGVSKPAKLKKI